MTKADWLKLGQELGYCGPLICIQHDGIFTEDEAEAIDRGDDPCLFGVRVLEDRSVVNLAVVP